MRRRESVTTAPHPGLNAVEDPNMVAIIRDIYDSLYREPQAVAAQTVVSPWHDRGDPAASDWDEGDLTEDAAWHELDLTAATVPASAKLVLLRVVMVTGAQEGVAYFRRAGNANTINASAVLEVSDDQGRDVWVTPNAGVIEYMLDFTGGLSIDITVAGWFT